jgi:hypothetical protein
MCVCVYVVVNGCAWLCVRVHGCRLCMCVRVRVCVYVHACMHAYVELSKGFFDVAAHTGTGFRCLEEFHDTVQWLLIGSVIQFLVFSL